MSSINFELKWCSNCLAMSTRPRISFDKDGKCNACVWQEKKKNLDWSLRTAQLTSLLNVYRSSEGEFDCLVPCSGGKDGSYVAYNLKHKYGMNPLAVTVSPPLPLEIGEQNLKNFISSGYDHISINPNFDAMKVLNKYGFIELGFPYYGWLIAIHTAFLKTAIAYNINLIFYGEDGEVEYGGSTESEHDPIYGVAYQKKVYLEGGYEKVLKSSGLEKQKLNFFMYPEDDASHLNIKLTHWSYFENWDPYRNYLIAKEHCGLIEANTTNSGTFTNFAQNDQALYSLHSYIMYLKYGFGRANQDACIEIRRGAMDREQAINLVNLYDGQYPEQYIEMYLEYFDMTHDEFNKILDIFANKNLFKKQRGRWSPNFDIK